MENVKILIKGEFRGSSGIRDVVNPFSGAVVESVFQADAGDIDDAIAAAQTAFQMMRNLSAHQRSEALSSAAHEVERRKEEFASRITLETGKPLLFSRVEVDRSVFTLRTAAEEARRLGGEIVALDAAPANHGRLALVRRFPLGVIGAITPFNFPLNLVCHKVGPALAAGNTVVLKPSSNAPGIALMLGEVFEGTGFPSGSFNIIPCSGAKGEQLLTDQRVKMLSFTGSPAVGWELKAKAPKKRITLELGGNAAVIVCKDAKLAYALDRIVQGAFGNAGQSCISVQRAYVHEDLADECIRELVQRTAALPVGDPFDPKTIVGPMIDEAAAAKAESWIREAVQAGARVLTGGTRAGAILQPTVLADVDPALKVSCQEVFAPVVTVDRFSSFSDALASVNRSSFGLQAGVFTNTLSEIFQAYRELEVGGVIINDASSYRADHMPYGGVKESGTGREGLKYAIEEMTEMKLLALNPG